MCAFGSGMVVCLVLVVVLVVLNPLLPSKQEDKKERLRAEFNLSIKNKLTFINRRTTFKAGILQIKKSKPSP